jgi:ech hydrogenase subunit E
VKVQTKDALRLKPRSVIPFGPQHPVFPEPLQLKLTVEEEMITEAIPVFGYVHRGLEQLCAQRDFHQMVQVVERVCGICSVMHAMCYCQAIEEIMAVEVPRRAVYLRTIWAELHRLQSHLLWLGLFADSFGFESLFMQFWRIREKVLDINEATAGNRVIVSINVIGGVRRDLAAEHVRWLLPILEQVETDIRRLESTVIDDVTIRKRTVGKGILNGDRARELGAVGPTLRGSGVAQDTRQTGYAVYAKLDFQPVVETSGDCYARCRVRFYETLQSIDLIRQAVALMPPGDITVTVKGRPQGEAVARVEQPRGELFYYIKAGGSKNLERVRIRAPSFANMPSLVTMLPGMWLSDVPVIVLSIDPCISCTER